MRLWWVPWWYGCPRGRGVVGERIVQVGWVERSWYWLYDLLRMRSMMM